MSTPQDPQYPQYPQYPSQPPQPPYPTYPTPPLPQQPPAPYAAPPTTPFGASWGQVPPVPAGGGRRRPPTWIIIVGATFAGVMALCSSCFGLAALAGGGNFTSGGTSLSATSTPHATDTPDPNAHWQDYRDLVATDASMLKDDFDAVSTSCGDADVAQCRSDVRTLDGDVQDFLKDLNDNFNPPPPCMKSVDTHLRSALHHYDAGAKDVLNGIDNIDSGLIDKGSSEFTAGGKEMNKASAAIDAASCG